MAAWSTDAIRPAERFSFWREIVCQTVLNVSTEAPRDGFHARIAGRSFGDLRFAAFASTSHEIVRSSGNLARFPEDNYLISLQQSGQSQIQQAGAAFALDPGEIAIVDGQKPFRISFAKPVSRVLAIVSRQTLDMRAPWLRKVPQRKIALSAPYANLARRHLLELAAGCGIMTESEARLLTENLCNLLTLASAPDIAVAALRPDVQLEAVLTFCRRHLGDPELSPRTVAGRFGISVRTLHLRFGKVGRSFCRWVLESRLDRCREALRDPRQATCSISEIAYRWGFNDLSHFDKVFRARFGMTPRQWRRAAQA